MEEGQSICNFLTFAASLTECQSGSKFATLSVTIKAYKILLAKCTLAIENNDTVMKPIAEAMYAKLKKYDSLICSDIAQLALAFDPRFSND